MSLPTYSLTSNSPYRWKPKLVGLTTPVLMDSEDAVLPLPHVVRPTAHWDKRTCTTGA